MGKNDLAIKPEIEMENQEMKEGNRMKEKKGTNILPVEMFNVYACTPNET